MITPEEIARLRELEKKATPGPWKYSRPFEWIESNKHQIIAQTWGKLETPFVNDVNNSALIIAARNALPDLLDEIERLRHELVETGAILAISRKGVRDLSDDLAATLKRAEAAEEDADTLAELLNASLDNGEPRTAPEDVEIEALCLRLGFGAVLSSAARLWARRDDTGAFTLGHCRAIVGSALANHEIAKGGEE